MHCIVKGLEEGGRVWAIGQILRLAGRDQGSFIWSALFTGATSFGLPSFASGALAGAISSVHRPEDVLRRSIESGAAGMGLSLTSKAVSSIISKYKKKL